MARSCVAYLALLRCCPETQLFYSTMSLHWQTVLASCFLLWASGA